MILGVVGYVIEGLVLDNTLVHILRLDLMEKAVSVRVEELAAPSVLRFELLVIKVVHQVLGEIHNAHAHIHRRGPGFDTRSGNILSFLLPLFQEGQLSINGESMCTKYWLTA